MEYAQQNFDAVKAYIKAVKDEKRSILIKKKEEYTDADKHFLATFDTELGKLEGQMKEWMEIIKIQVQAAAQGSSLISPSQFLEFTLPQVSFGPKEAKKSKNSKLANDKQPKEVVEWDDFIPGALSFSFPPKIEETLSSYEKSVDTAIETNLDDNLNRFFKQINPSNQFNVRPENLMKGVPDHEIYKEVDGKKVIYSFIEDKTIHDLPTPPSSQSLVDWWKEDVASENSSSARVNSRKSIYGEISQVYGYMPCNSLRYAVLTTYESTWFICRPSYEVMKISPRIACNDTHPTLLRCFCYFLSLLEVQHWTPKSPRKNETKITKMHDIPDEFDVEDLVERIGDGASGSTWLWLYQNKKFAVKLCDLKFHEAYNMMKEEIKIYQCLKPMQGKKIPKIYFSGKTSNYFVICMDFIEGRTFDAEHDQEQVILQINSITDELATYGIIHDDLRPSNIIIDPSGKVFLIDFGKCLFI